jgi:hypothetical protein
MKTLAKLLRAEAEAINRVHKAQDAHEEANQKLNAALEAGQETSAARRLAHETSRLVKFATADLANIRSELADLREAEAAEMATGMVAEAHRAGLGITYREATNLAQAFARASALGSGKDVAEGVAVSGGFSRAFGLDRMRTAGLFGQMRYLGATGKNGMDEKQLALMFADAIGSGKMWSKADEVMQSIAQWVQTAERTQVTTPNMRAYADMAAKMNKLGSEGLPGLRGPAGAALLQAIDQAIRSGGRAGAAGENMMWQALNDNQGPMLDPFRAKLLEQHGMFASRKSVFGNSPYASDRKFATSGKSVLASVIGEIQSRYGGANPYIRDEALANELGLSMPQADALYRIADLHGGIGKLSTLFRDNDLQLKNLDMTGFKELTSIAYASHDKLGKIKAQFLKRDDLTNPEKNKISHAENDQSLRKALAEAAAKHGQTGNIGLQVQEASSALQKALSKEGNKLLAPLNAIKQYTAEMVNGTGGLASDTKNALWGAGKKRTQAQKRLGGFLESEAMKLFHGANKYLYQVPLHWEEGLAKQAGERLEHGFSHYPLPAPKLAPVAGRPVRGSHAAHSPQTVNHKHQFEMTIKDPSGRVKGIEYRESYTPAPVGHHG